MTTSIKEYDLSGGDPRGLLKAFEATSYLEKHGLKAFQAHRHRFYQLIWFKTKGSHFIDYKVFEHPENSLFFIDEGQVHYFCDESPNEGLLFHFNDSFLNRYEFDAENWAHYRLFHQLGSPYLELSGALLGRVTNLKDLLLEELEAKEFGFEKQAYFLFRLILLNMERVKRMQNQNLLNTKGDFDEIVRFHALADQSLSENLPVAYYAKELGMSPKKLSTLVSKYLGNSPANVINEKKVMEAKRLLSNSKLSVKEIGYRLGFNQATYFTKFFKKYATQTPKEFRQNNEERDASIKIK